VITDIAAQIQSGGGIWRAEAPASVHSLELSRAAVAPGIPDTYFQLLSFSNGGEGDLGIEPGWFCPWPAEEVISNNLDYEVVSYGSYFGFGSNGGGELFAFDLSGVPPWPIVMFAFIGGEPRRIASDFDDFVRKVGRAID
jgi:hypothetical protein